MVRCVEEEAQVVVDDDVAIVGIERDAVMSPVVRKVRRVAALAFDD